MSVLKKIGAIALILFIGISPLYAQNGIQVGAAAPEFTIYKYKDESFNTDDVYGKKIVSIIFGSIT